LQTAANFEKDWRDIVILNIAYEGTIYGKFEFRYKR
jgi:hypothetical protein